MHFRIILLISSLDQITETLKNDESSLLSKSSVMQEYNKVK